MTSRDGTAIGYRRLGRGPGLILVHGAGQSAENLMRLAAALSADFTVYVVDRRGRGSSGPHRPGHALETECDDVGAVARHTGARNIFGLSSGAIIALQAGLVLPGIRKVALCGPPLSVNHSTPIRWLPRFDRQVAAGRLGSALTTAVRGTRTAPPLFRFVPRFILGPLLDVAARQDPRDRASSGHSGPGNAMLRALLWPLRRIGGSRSAQAGSTAGKSDAVSLKSLVPTVHYDGQLVIETEGLLAGFKDVQTEVPLLGGSKSPRYLKATLDALERVLRRVRGVELRGADHVAADNNGQPGRVAAELRRFFAQA